MTINIGLVCPNPNDATSFYRAWGVFSEIRKNTGAALNLTPMAAASWASIIDLDILFLQRPHTLDHAAMAEMAALSGVPVWLDYDDAIWATPPDNPAYPFYASPDLPATLLRIAKSADIITVSTDAIRQQMKKSLPVRVIRNQLPERWAKMSRGPRARSVHDPIRILWRGGSTHAEDWRAHLPAAIEASRSIPNIQWALMGAAPHFVVSELKTAVGSANVTRYPELYISQYFKTIVHNDPLQADICFVPLVDSPFNKGKSNIAMLECVAGGILPVTPGWPEWSTTTYKYNYTYADPAWSAKALTAACEAVRSEPDSVTTLIRDLQQEFREAATGNQARLNIINELKGEGDPRMNARKTCGHFEGGCDQQPQGPDCTECAHFVPVS